MKALIRRIKSRRDNKLLPGGLCEESFYKHCREGGLEITPADAKFMRDSWIATFREMKYHMSEQEPMRDPVIAGRQFGIPGVASLAANGVLLDDDDEDDENYGEADNRRMYMARSPSGMRRANATINAAENFTFQSQVAYGAKLAGWNLLYAGYGPRLRNFVHDEYIYVLRPEELEEHIPIIEGLMLAGMRQAIPDVKIGVETSCCLHWDKHAPEFAKLQKDESTGLYIVQDCEEIARIKESKCNSQI